MEETKKNKKHIFSKILLFILLIFVCVFLYSKYIGTRDLIIKEYLVESKKIPKSFNGIKIVQFSDLLYSNDIDEKQLNNLVNTINILNPDIVIFSGNISYNIKKFNNKAEKNIIKYLSIIDSSLGSYYISSKTDEKLKNYKSIMDSSSFVNIDNKIETVFNNNDSIIISGLMTDEKILFEENKYNILVVSQTNNINNILKKEVKPNLIFGGSSLNGTIVLPYFGPLFIEKESKDYYAPYYKKGNTVIYVSSGIGTRNIKYRLFNKPSINFYRFKSLQ